MIETKTRAELKSEVKSLFRGRWKDAILLNLVPTILQVGAVIIGFFLIAAAAVFIGVFFQNFDGGSTTSMSESYNGGGYGGGGGGGILGFLIALISIGISFTFLDWLRDPAKQIKPFKEAFQVYTSKNFIPVVLVMILSSIFTFLWSLLFIIPGIIKGIAYSQAYFIYKDVSSSGKNEGMGYTDYITASRKLMHGHKWDYFVLQLSFIGWHILAMLSLGIGYLWLNPYMSATYAAFYRDLARDRYLASDVKTEDIEIDAAF